MNAPATLARRITRSAIQTERSTSFLRIFFVVAAIIALALSGATAQAQNLRFAPVITGIDSVNGAGAGTIMRGPSAVTADVFGNIYIADTNAGIIRKVDPTGTAKIFAGTGGFLINGNNGDGGPAIAAVFGLTTALAADLSGNIYITDAQNFRVRKVDKAGIVTTFAGGNGNGSTGDGGAATAAQITPGALASDSHGNIYIADTTCECVRIVNTSGIISTVAGGGTDPNGNGGPATLAKLKDIEGLATDGPGNLYIADYGSSNVRKVNALGNISIFAGTTSGYSGDGGLAVNAQLRNPVGLATDTFGDVFISDFFSYDVRMVDGRGIISTLAGSTESTTPFDDGLPADFVQMAKPRGIATDPNGNIYITVPEMDRAYEVVMHPEVFPQTLIGNTSISQRLVLENYGNTDVTISHTNAVTFSGDFHPAVFSTSGNQCSANIPLEAHSINWCTVDVVFTPTAEGIRSFPLTISTDAGPVTQTLTSTGLGGALAMNTGQLFIIGGDHLSDGNRGEGGPAIQAQIEGLYDIAIDSSGNVFFSEATCQVRRIDGQTGIVTTIAGNPEKCGFEALQGDGGPAIDAFLPSAENLALDSHNNLYVTDGRTNVIRRIDTSGIITTFAGALNNGFPAVSCPYTPDGGPAIQALFCGPANMKFDKNGNLFFLETNNEIVRKIDTAGILTTVAGNHNLGAGFSGDGGPATSAQLNGPQGLAIDAAGDLFISDTYNDVVRRVDGVTGIITTIAGQHGIQGITGDGQLAKNATLSYPEGLDVDAAGDVFVADRNNSQIRKIDTSGYITTVAGNRILGQGFNGDRMLATATELSVPNNLVVGPSGYIYIADTANDVIRELTPNGMLDFTAQKVGTISKPESITLSNVGNRPLHFASEFPTGITGDFATVSGGDCDFIAILAVGASCNVDLTFAPTIAGPRYGIFAFYDDGVTTTQYVALSGTGTAQQAQTINFTPIATHVYGDPTFSLTAIASSGLPVSFTVQSGNAAVTGNTVTITGTGPVVIAADQAGNDSWLPAPTVTRSFNIGKATLTVTAANRTSEGGQALQPLLSTTTGFVNNDQPSVVTGAPALSTTATSGTVNSFPISITIGTLATANYTFNLIPGTYSVTPAPTVPDGVVKLVTTTTITKTDGLFHVIVTVANNGTAIAQKVTLTSVKLNSLTGSPAPQSMGNIPAGGIATAITTFAAGAGSSGASVIEQIVGSYTGGTFGGSYRAVLP